MYLIVGLGNPGKEYAYSRHNIGFMAIDRIASEYPASEFKQHKKGLVASINFDQSKIILLKPITYMNLSGEALLDISTFYKIPAKNIIVIHDDIDLLFGTLKLKFGGGHAGHNGLRNIDNYISPNYWRLRIGIGRPQSKEDVARYVLTDFSEPEKSSLESILERIAKSVPSFFTDDDKQKLASQLAEGSS